MSSVIPKLCFATFCLTLVLPLSSSLGQRPVRHELIRGDMPPGLASSYYQMHNRSLVGHVQPVQLIVPDDCVIEAGGAAGFGKAQADTMVVGLMAGPVYRFRISNLPIPGKRDQALYPSIEVINRTYPPAELKNQFPVEIHFTAQDLELALRGQLVTRVIYLEDPRGPLPHVHAPGQQPSLDIGGGADPLRTSERLGRPLAIVRLGSRVPMPNDPVEQFNFGAPEPEVLPVPDRAARLQAARRLADKVSKTTSNIKPVSHAQPVEPAKPVRSAAGVETGLGDSSSGNASGAGFVPRNQELCDTVLPLPLGTIESAHAMSGHRSIAFGRDRLDPAVQYQEYVFDGDDRDSRTQVDSSWNVSGLDPEDTVAHFDTLDGQRIVAPSNRVAIYAPRFASIRKVHGALNAQRNLSAVAVDERLQTVMGEAADRLTTTKQHDGPRQYKGSRRPTGLQDRTRGLMADGSTNLVGFRNALEIYRQTAVLPIELFDGAQGAWLQQGLQSAVAWESDLGLRVFAKGIQPIIVRDVKIAQGLMAVESKDGTAILRVLKTASQASAKTGEEVEFTIRFDNVSSKAVGNVTIMDNLTRRLEFVEGSQSCSLEANFVNEVNEVGSLMLRWEVNEPVEAGTGGVVKFRCRVR